MLALHRARQRFVKARTAQANQIRGLLGEYGLILPQGLVYLARWVPALLEEASDLPAPFRRLIERLLEHLKVLQQHVEEIEREMKAWHQTQVTSRRLAAVPGVGVLTATALAAAVGDARHFASGRQFAAWLGLVPRQWSSGGKPNLLGMSKRGDPYLRTLLIHGARAVMRHAMRRGDPNGWLMKLLGRRPKNVAIVALANKNARILWVLLARDRPFEAGRLATG